MSLLMTYLWPGLAGALVLGLGAGCFFGWPRGAVTPAVLTLAVAVLWGVALSGIAPGRIGLWIESAAFMLPGYIAGCLAGALIRQIVRKKPRAVPV